jgi:DNA gyrase subunit A
LPAAIPNLLVNGSSGIAVGMATNIPPHNMTEVVTACVALIDNPEMTPAELRAIVKGPDFPTGSFIYGRQGISDYQDTGRGKIVMRARAVIEEKETSGRAQIVITEIPYMVNRANLVISIADLVREKKIEGVSALRDESDANTRIVVELKRDAIPKVVLNQLYKHTSMQSTFGVIMLALVPDATTRRLVPKIMPLKEVLERYLEHRHEVIVRRTEFDLKKAKDREHILDGLKICVDNIDAVIKLIRAADDTDQAQAQLMERFALSELQSKAILDMRLAKLTGLEREKLEEELTEVKITISDLTDLLNNKPRRMKLMKAELQRVKDDYGDDRRTEIVSDAGEFSVEDLIANEEMVVTISHGGYIKRTPVSTYRKQRRGGRGLTGTDLKDADFVQHLFIGATHDYLLVFTNDGRVYWLKIHEIPEAGRSAKGKPIVNLINVSADTRVAAVQPVKKFSEDEYLMFCTQKGTIKKTALAEYGNVRTTGIKAIKIEEGDILIDVQVTSGINDIILATKHGLSVRFHESDARAMGRDTTGVKGIELGEGDAVIGMVVLKRDAELLVVTEKGLGKRTKIEEYRVQKRGGKGIFTCKRTERTGDVVGLLEVIEHDEIMLITRGGIMLRASADGVRETGRNAQGVKLVSLDFGDMVTAVARVVPDDEKAVEEGPEEEQGEAQIELSTEE